MSGTSLPKDNFVLNGVRTLETFVSHAEDAVHVGKSNCGDATECVAAYVRILRIVTWEDADSAGQ